jgi:hypothetical protein
MPAFLLSTQTFGKPKETSLHAIARIDSSGCRVMLRWAASDPQTWRQSNRYGVAIERYTVLRDGHLLPQPERKQLTPAPLKPLPAEAWRTIIETNDNAAVVAQALYGESFTTDAGESKIARITAQSEEQSQRFSFSLMAADRDFKVACMAGWGFADTTAKASEKYLYRIYTLLPPKTGTADTALVFIGKDNYSRLPVPKELNAVFGDKKVMLSWNNRLLQDEYTSYMVERSDDGTTFRQASGLPTATVSESPGVPEKMFFADSLPGNDRPVYYRIRGVNCFGETGPPSETVTGQGKQTVEWMPHITDATLPDDSTAVITWTYPEEGIALIDHFELERAANLDDNRFETLNNNISREQRRISFRGLLPSNYFTITAIDKYGSRHTSFPKLVQPVDSIPPAIPAGVAATVDSLGTVTVTWKANTEPDLLGYTVLRKNIAGEEASVVNKRPLTNNRFTEKTSLNTLNGKVYYAVMALDKRMNQSKPSVFAEAVKPDKIPPVAPAFTGYLIENNGAVRLTWVNGPSDDVAVIRLFRKPKDGDTWTSVKSFTPSDSTVFTDTDAPDGTQICYSLMAEDTSGNGSEMSSPLTVTSHKTALAAVITKLKATGNKATGKVIVTWQASGSTITGFTVYKSVNGAPFATWKITGASQQQAEDDMPKNDTSCRYAVRATLADGNAAGWKETKITGGE